MNRYYGIAIAVIGLVMICASSMVVYASTEQDSFDLMVRVLSDADEKRVLPDTLREVLIEVLAEHLDEVVEQDVYQTDLGYLIVVLRDARDAGVWDENMSGLLSDYLIEHMIAPDTGETPDAVRERLSVEPDRFAEWNELEPQDWWRESEPYTCLYPEKETSPWIEAEMMDLGGQDSLSLIRYYGNGSYLRYDYMGLGGCSLLTRYPDQTYLDRPVDPTYYSLGDLEIAVDIARVPQGAPAWFEDDGKREDMTMAQAVDLLNMHVANYYRKISESKLRIRFVAGNEFELEGEEYGTGSPFHVIGQQMLLLGVVDDCLESMDDSDHCSLGAPGALNRIMLTDVTSDTGGYASNGRAGLGLVSLRKADMEVPVHEVGHAWMGWPHSFAEVYWEGEGGVPNPYSNRLDFMSTLSLVSVFGWYQDMPSTLAVNRYSAGWIDPKEVALHLSETGTYTLQPPRKRGYQFLVISSGRKYAFTTVEVLDERNPAYNTNPDFRYQGVLVSRYDQSRGTGVRARFGPALYEDSSSAVNMGEDDFSVLQDGESRDIGGGVSLEISRNEDGSYQVSVTGGRIAEFKPWCPSIWFTFGKYDTGCSFDKR